MGLLKYKIYCVLIAIVLAGCAKSIIKYTAQTDDSPHQMFGRTADREFFVPVELSDSLSLLWESDMYGSFPNSSVSVYEDLVFVNDLSGRIFCYNMADGDMVGTLKHTGGAVYSTPVPFKNIVIFPVAQEDDNYTELVYYDYQNGKEIEIIEIPGRVITNIIVQQEEILFTTEIGTAYKFNLLGKKIWETDTRVPTRSDPALSNNLFVFGNDKGELIALDATNGDSVYVENIGGAFYCGLTIKDKIIYCGNENGNLYAINVNNGETLWNYSTGARILMTPVVDEKNVFVGNLKGYIFSINKSTGEKKWESEFKGIFNSTPLVSNNLVILPDALFSIHLLNKEDGRTLKSIELEGRAKLSPVYHRNLLFIGYDAGILRAYEFVD